jgi:hypothetical protein
MTRFTLLFLALAALWAPAARAAEGKWTPQQILELDPAWLRAQGLKLKPSQLWDNKKGTGLLAGAINTEGCSGGFIAPDGLFITNHHCLFEVIQEHSTPERDLLKDGFIARGRAQELPGKAERVLVLRRFTDVTAEVLAAAKDAQDDLQRFRAIERRRTELAQACEQRPATRCQVEAFDGGLSYVLFDALMLQDVRLVYAPPRAVGEFGGEIDNWSWPRHTGDFAIGRAYVGKDGSSRPYDPENVPYRTPHYFPLSTDGVSPGDFVAVLGYPGTTFRALIAEEMSERRDLFYPAAIGLLGEWISILQSVPDPDAAGKIAVAPLLKSLQNRHKNARGQLDGFQRWEILERRRVEDAAVKKWAEARPEHRAAVEAHQGLVQLSEDRKRAFAREFLLGAVAGNAVGNDPMRPPWGSRALYLATLLARWSTEREKPELERAPAFLDREARPLEDRFVREQKNYHPATDQKLFASFVRRALALPADQRSPAIDAAFQGAADAAEIDRRVQALYAGSRLMDPAERAKMVRETAAQLRARKDPLLDLGFALAPELAGLRDALDRRLGASYRLSPAWRRAVIAHAGKPVAPDANRTLRVSLAKVKGYSPRDGIQYTPQTTLSGLIAKHTGQDPMDVPARVRDAAAAGKLGQWMDRKLGDVPVAFLSDADTTGGNSGSPVIDGRGRLVGVNFDRVWENVANDFGYLPEVGRNISVEVRYILWLLDQVDGADELLDELGVRR